MLDKVIVDTGILVAAIDRRDSHHSWVTEQLKHISPPLLTCEAVIFRFIERTAIFQSR
jgi:uncharacterized protein